VTYFKSLVRSKNPDNSMLINLIKDISNPLVRDSNEFEGILKAEYKYFIEGNFDECCSIFETTLEEFPYLYPAYKSYYEICLLEERESKIKSKKYNFDPNPVLDNFLV
jgi:hypothetical protein